MSEPPPLPPPFAKQAARASWMAPLVALLVGFVATTFMRQQDVDQDLSRVASAVIAGVAILLGFAGLISGFIGLSGIPKHGAKGLLIPSALGILLSSAYLLLVVFASLAVRAMAAEQRAVSQRTESIHPVNRYDGLVPGTADCTRQYARRVPGSTVHAGLTLPGPQESDDVRRRHADVQV